MKKLIIIIAAAVIAAEVVTVSVLATKNKDTDDENTLFDDRPVSEMSEEEKEAEYSKVENESAPVIHGTLLVGARRIKRLKMLSGLLPANQPSLTLQQVLDVMNDVALTPGAAFTVKSRLDEIAGCPDIEWGSGSANYLYFIDQSKGEYVNVCGKGSEVYFWSPDGKKYIYIDGLGYVFNEKDAVVQKKWKKMIDDMMK